MAPSLTTTGAAFPGRLADHRQQLAAARLAEAEAALDSCEICACRCRANRRAGPAGRCGAGPEPRIFSAQVEVGDELEIIPAYTVALSGCNMRCAFCITGDESWHPARGVPMDAAAVASRAAAEIATGRAQTLLVLGGEPTIHLPWLLRLAAAMPAGSRLALKTNGLSTAAARDLLSGLFDFWIVDFKFGSETCAKSLSLTGGYPPAVRETLLWAADDQNATLIVRHLLMPGHVECCWRPIAAWLADRMPGVRVSLRSGYWPSWRAVSKPPLDRPLAAGELGTAMTIARHFNLRLVA